MSNAEFQIIVSELEQYNALKEKVRAKLTRTHLVRMWLMLERSKMTFAARLKLSFEKTSAVSPPLRINNCKQAMLSTNYKIMIASFHVFMCLVNDYFKPEWQETCVILRVKLLSVFWKKKTHGTAV